MIAAKAVADLVRTSLGPKGMDKMIVQANDEVIITNDGATILQKIDILHPAAKMVFVFFNFFSNSIFSRNQQENIYNHSNEQYYKYTNTTNNTSNVNKYTTNTATTTSTTTYSNNNDNSNTNDGNMVAMVVLATTAATTKHTNDPMRNNNAIGVH